MLRRPNSIDVYHRRAAAFAERYEAIAFERAHKQVLEWLPDSPGLVLDLGAGSGRDAAWFAARGHEVFAVEPATALRDQAAALHTNPNIHWIDDRLPELVHIGRSATAWDVIWLSAVWMHLPVADRERAFRKLANRLRPGGRMIISLRHGDFDDERVAHPVSVDELLRLARDHSLVCRATMHSDDAERRSGVSWEHVVLELPDDGSGAFPILRSIILNDAKSSTYKLALLRCLIRIANSASGLAVPDGNGQVRLPLGLVALYWIRSYLPLLHGHVAQLPTGSGRPGFAKTAFNALDLSPYGLKVGARVRGEQARHLHAALHECARLIRDMPAQFITWPNTDKSIFTVKTCRTRSGSDLVLDDPTLESFGEFHVPEHLWNAMARHAAWIEPALEAEWIALMQKFDGPKRRSWEDYQALLRWLDPRHDTSTIRSVVDHLRSQSQVVHCVWTSHRLADRYAIDHLMPFVRWPCNDLWNLAPATMTANSRKGDRLPSAETLHHAEDRLCGWWERLRAHSELTQRQFDDEVRSALPFVLNPADPGEVFEGLAILRASPRRDQQIPEWSR